MPSQRMVRWVSMHSFAGRFWSVPGAKCWPAGVSTERSARKTSASWTTSPPGSSTTATARRNGWWGAASHGSSSNQPMNDCGSSTCTRTSTTPERLALFSRVPACGSSATFASAPRPVRLRRRVVADLVDLGRRLVDVRPELPARPQRVDEDPVAAGRKDPFADVDVPGVAAPPADEVARVDLVPDPDERVDVLVAEVADVDEPPVSVRRRADDLAALDRVDAVSPARRRARLGTVVAHCDVDAVVVDRAQLRIRAGVHERAADRVRLVHGRDRPATVGVVVRLGRLEFSGTAMCGLSQTRRRFQTGGGVGKPTDRSAASSLPT